MRSKYNKKTTHKMPTETLMHKLDVGVNIRSRYNGIANRSYVYEIVVEDLVGSEACSLQGNWYATLCVLVEPCILRSRI